MVLTMWEEKASAPMQALHLGFGIGSTIAPLIAEPYLTPSMDNIDTFTTNVTLGRYILQSTNIVSATKSHNISRIQIPYAMSGAWCVVVSLVMLVFYVYPVPQGVRTSGQDKPRWDIRSSSISAQTQRYYYIFMKHCNF